MLISTMSSAYQKHLIKSMTKELNKRFCDDRKLPLKIYTGDIFINRLKLFGEYNKYISYCHEVQRLFANTQDYFEYYNKVKDNAINYIKESKAFQMLNSDNMNEYSCKYNFQQSNVYKASNVGKKFISIDMSKANFSSLVSYGKSKGVEFFKNFNYNEFMKQFTDVEHIIESKYIRQVIFGNCNPKRQVTYEKYLMGLVLQELFTKSIITENMVYSLCSDEIIIKVDSLTSEEISRIADEINNIKFNVPLRLEVFQLGRIEGSEAFIKRVFNSIQDEVNYAYVLKCVNPDEAPFIHRLINNQPIKDEDNIFLYNGKLARLIEVPELSINFTDEYN